MHWIVNAQNLALPPNLSHNAAVQRPRDHVSSAPHVHNEVTHMRRASDVV
jgi:hypothetical protein